MRGIGRNFLGQVVRLTCALSLAVMLVVASGWAQNSTPVSLQTSETLFTVLTAINTCGYDQELNVSDPLRGQIRSEVAKAVENTAGAQDVIGPMCLFYRQHQTTDPARDLSQYVSLALYLDDPPTFTLKVKAAELPPDAAVAADIVPLLQTFYQKIALHAIWERHHARYTELTEIYHTPLAKMTFDTEIYLKMPSAGYLGRQFTVYLDAMGAPGQTNARNYASDYYVVISPTSGTAIKMQQIRHTYLHYLLDPLALKNADSFKRLEPLLVKLQDAPMDEAFKSNISLLVTECLVRAIEERLSKIPEADRVHDISQDDKEGYVLTHYFYDAMARFESDPAGMRNAYPYLLGAIDINKEIKRVSQIEFAAQAEPELLHLAGGRNQHLLLDAERRLAAGDVETAQKLAQKVLDEQEEDPGRALFILAQVATVNRDMEGARKYFERALQTAHETKVIAWSHIYLGRIFDLKEDRIAAVDQYRAALDVAGATLPEAKLAAQRGLDQPYEPPVAKQPE
ncbi:MAG: tetratricopeptide repeat protein [Terriglobales bacterium]|jgi:tetratricopeptide (TPR) repeat protein